MSQLHRALAALKMVALPFLLSRLWVALWVYAGHVQHPFREKLPGSYEGVSNWWLNAWTLYDSEHFFHIAQQGYDVRTAPFFPLYPMLLKLFAFDENAMALWGFVISNIAFWGMLAAFYFLTQYDVNEQVAKRAVWLLAFFPISAIFSAVYTDALFGLLLVGTFFLIRQQRWMFAALCAFLAALTRNSGPLIFVALAMEWWRLSRDASTHMKLSWQPLICILSPLIGFTLAQFYIGTQAGFGASLSSQKLYDRAPTWPWIPIWNDFVLLLQGKMAIVIFINLLCITLAIVFGVLYARKQPSSYTVFLLGMALMQLTLARTFPPYTISSVRYMATTFPFTQCMARGLQFVEQNPLRRWSTFFVYAMLNAVISFLFGHKAFVP